MEGFHDYNSLVESFERIEEEYAFQRLHGEHSQELELRKDYESKLKDVANALKESKFYATLSFVVFLLFAGMRSLSAQT